MNLPTRPLGSSGLDITTPGFWAGGDRGGGWGVGGGPPGDADPPPPLPPRPLGWSGLDITTVGFGAWAIGGGGWAFGWGPQDDADSLAAMRRALELGINWIDTAAGYGLGPSEAGVG